MEPGATTKLAVQSGQGRARGELLVSDYRVKISVSNARIRKAMESAGYTSVLQMCRVKNLPIGNTFDLVNMKLSPLSKKGEWRKCVLSLADALYCLPNDLFSERQKVVVLKTSTGTKDVTEAELVRLSEQYVWDDRLEDMQDNAAINQIAHEEAENLMAQVLETALTPTEKKVLELRFATDSGTPSLHEVARKLDLSVERIRQVELKALRKLRGHVEREGSEVGKILRDLNDEVSGD
jgi:RNA polymerase sigma factor (sigma-70 family)